MEGQGLAGVPTFPYSYAPLVTQQQCPSFMCRLFCRGSKGREMEETGVRHCLGMLLLGHLCSYPALLVKSQWSLQGVNKSQVSRRARNCFYGIEEEKGSAWSEHPGERLKPQLSQKLISWRPTGVGLPLKPGGNILPGMPCVIFPAVLRKTGFLTDLYRKNLSIQNNEKYFFP